MSRSNEGLNLNPIQSAGLTKTFGNHSAIKNLSFDLRPGERVALMGSNGSGKSTLFSICSGLRRPNQGNLLIFGEDPRSQGARSLLGYSPQKLDFPEGLRTKEVFHWVSKLRESLRPRGAPPSSTNLKPRAHGSGLIASGVTTTIDQLIRAFELDQFWDRPCGGLSGGQMRRLSLAMSLFGQPSLLLLDEPSTGLDIRGQIELLDLLEHQLESEGVSLFLSTHSFGEAAKLCSRVLFLSQGELKLDVQLKESAAHLKSQEIESFYLEQIFQKDLSPGGPN